MDPDDRHALLSLVEEYARTADERDADGVARLFTENGVLVSRLDSDDTDRRRVSVGRSEIARTVSRLRALVSCSHVVLSTTLSIRGGESSGTSLAAVEHVYRAASGDRVENLIMRYDDEFDVESGLWRFARRELTVIERRDSPLS